MARRYALGRKIGSGGMGTVWLAHDQSLDRLCALKILDPDKAANVEVRKRFVREARTTAQIRSPHVVEVFEYGQWDGLPFIVMELLDGEGLGKRLDRRGKLDFEAAYSIIAQVARALARAHALGIVHRDLKPENVFLTTADGGEIVKVVDFGIAHHAIYSPRDRATQAGSVMGTPCFMSPEQALGRETDWRTDLWALGVVAYECLTGKLPFLHDTLGGLLSQILYEPIPSIREQNPTLPPAVEAWWRRASAREPECRFQTAAELSNGLADALAVREPLAVPNLVPCSEAHNMEAIAFDDASGSAVEFAGHVGSDAPVAMDTGEIITQFRRRVRRRSVVSWGALVAVVSALVALGAWLRTRLTDARALVPSNPPALIASVPAVSEPAVPVPSPVPPPIESTPPVVAPPAFSSAPPSASAPVPFSGLEPAVRKRSFARPPPRAKSWSKPVPSTETKPKPSRDYGI